MIFKETKQKGVASTIKYLNSLQVDSLKGIRNLELQNFSVVNLLTGPNGSGKSTILDAIELITNPSESLQYVKTASNASNLFWNLFDKGEVRPRIRVSGQILEKPYYTELVSYENESETTFVGYHYFGIPVNGVLTNHTNPVELPLTQFQTDIISSPFVMTERIVNDSDDISFEKIAKDKTVKEKILSFLSLFDHRFSDIYSPDFKNTYLYHETYGKLEEGFFSAGIRKILKIVATMSTMRGGILLIDDFECHLSPQTIYESISLLYSLAKEKQIQLFITTHSQELIDEWLDLCNFYNELSYLKIIRLQSNGTTSSFTVFTGKEAYELRMEKELDFRYEYSKKGESYERIF